MIRFELTDEDNWNRYVQDPVVINPEVKKQILDSEKIRNDLENYVTNFNESPMWTNVDIMRDDLNKILGWKDDN